jgi:hypothetical protein
MSSDGPLLAVCGSPATGKKGEDQRVCFLDANTATVVGASPPQCDSELPDWGPAGSYLMALADRRRAVRDVWQLYYAPSVRRAPRSLAGPGRDMLALPTPSWESRLSPDDKTGVVLLPGTRPGAHTSVTKVFFVPVDTSAPARAVWSVRTQGWVTLLGAYEAPGPHRGAVAVLAGGPWGLRDESGIIALSVPTGDVLWERPFAPEPGWFNDSCLYDSHTLLVLEEMKQTERSKAGEESSTIYAVDLGSGDSRVFARVPDSCRWMRVFTESNGCRSVVLGDFNVWSVQVSGTAGRPRKVMEGPKSMRTRSFGSRFSADRGVEVYWYSWYTLWRCSLSERTVQPLLTVSPDARKDEPPTFVGSPALGN